MVEKCFNTDYLILTTSNFLFKRNPCSIELENYVIVTGGGQFGEEISYNTVSVYDTAGWVQDLPSLNKGRFFHGCGRYTDSSGKMVGNYFNHLVIFFTN